jgi:4-hydroxyproline epimerase
VPLGAICTGEAPRLLVLTSAIRAALWQAGITGPDGEELDHVELFGPPGDLPADSRNFVLCPGGAWDRSPCGTGTSAKLACLAADGKLRPGETWRQASTTGSIFECHYRAAGDRIVPVIRGSAWITAHSTLVFDRGDPFRWGLGI